MSTRVIVKDDTGALCAELAAIITREARTAIDARGVFFIGLSGGSLIKLFADCASSIVTDWSCWRLLFCDERLVPDTSEDSTFGAYQRHLTANGGTIPVRVDQFICVPTDVSVVEAAEQYEGLLKHHLPLSASGYVCADLLLLGIGPDGHTCSLFPGHALLEGGDSCGGAAECRSVAAVCDSPKPPAERITMTMSALGAARTCLFTVTGSGKAQVMTSIFQQQQPEQQQLLPAARVAAQAASLGQQLIWLLDKAAASKLPE